MVTTAPVYEMIYSRFSESKGGRGGGGRFGGRYGGGTRSVSTYRSGSSTSYRYGVSSQRVRVRYGSRYSVRPWYGGGYSSWHVYAMTGNVYGYNHYSRTRYYHDHPDKGRVAALC